MIIAMALALDPEVVIMDEPTTALDVVVQREILQQIEVLKAELGFAVLFVTHDLSLLLEFADRVAIMYAGEIVEEAPAGELFESPQHPYTVGLMKSFPPLTGLAPSPLRLRAPVRSTGRAFVSGATRRAARRQRLSGRRDRTSRAGRTAPWAPC